MMNLYYFIIYSFFIKFVLKNSKYSHPNLIVVQLTFLFLLYNEMKAIHIQ